MRTVIFDLDGTLVDSSADMIRAANACFRDQGLAPPLDPVADAHTAFRGARAMLRLGFARVGQGGAAEVERDYPRLLDHYAAHIAEDSRLYPGALEAVGRLRAAGYRVGICTNKPEALAVQLLDALAMTPHFDALIGADTMARRKPDPLPYRAAVERAGGALTRSLLVGDTETDRETARAAGVPCILVTFGPDGQGVEALAPDALLPSYDLLDDLVAELIG